MKLRADTLLIKTQFLVLTGIVIAQVFGKNATASSLFTMTFFLTVFLWLVMAEKRISRINVLAIMIVVVSCINVAVNALLTNTILSFSYIKKLIMFWSTVLFFAAMSEYKPDHKTVNFIFRVNTLLALFLLAMYILRNPQMHYWNNRVTAYLTFRFTNPNLTSVFLLSICVIEMIHAYLAGRWTGKMIHGGLAAVLAYFVVCTRARNALLLLAAFIAVYFCAALFPRWKWRMTKPMAALIAVFPAVFAVCYLLLIYTPLVQKVFEFLIGEGKPLDARVEIWMDAVRAIGSSPIVGAYSQISDGSGQSQLHNSHLDVAASYGVTVLLMLCVFLFYILSARKEKSANYLLIAGFAALLMSGIGEAMIFSGGLGVYIYSGILLMLANCDFENERLTI